MSTNWYCRHCGKSHTWSTSRAGQMVFCSCGKSVRVPQAPQEPPDDVPEDDDEGFEDVTEEAVPTAQLAGRKVVQYQAQEVDDRPSWREFIKGSELKHLILPISFMVLALVIRFGLVFVADTTGDQHVMMGLGIALATMALNTVTLLIGVGVVAHFTGTELGPIPLTIVKLASAGMLGSVIIGVAAAFEMRGLGAGTVAMHLVALLYWILFSLFFEMDLQETLMSVAIAVLLQAGTMCILWQH